MRPVATFVELLNEGAGADGRASYCMLLELRKEG